MVKNIVIVHLLAFLIFGYSPAFGQRQSQPTSVPKQEVKTQPKQANKLTSVAQKYLRKMEKSRNHHLREKIPSNHLSSKGKGQNLISKMEVQKKSPPQKDAPKAAADKRKDQKVVKK